MTAVPDHPGILLVATLEAMGMTQARLARRLRMSAKHVNQVCQGHAGISARLAVLLDEITGVGAEHWMHLQSVHDIATARAARLDEITAERDVDLAARARAAAVAAQLLGGAS